MDSIKQQGGGVASTISDMASNPKELMMGVTKVLAYNASEELKSAIASALTKALVKQNLKSSLSDGDKEINSYLHNLGVKIVFMAITILLALGEYLYLYKQYSQKKILLFCILSGVIGFVSTQILLWHYQIHFMEILKRCILLMLLFPIALCDWKKMIIPNKILLFGLIVRIFLYPFEFFFRTEQFLVIIKSDFIALGIMLLFLLVAYFLVKNGVGMGDIKLILIMSLYLGIQGIFGVLFMSLIVIFFAGLYLMIIKKRSKRESIPFAPAILAGTVISILVNGI